MNASPALRPQIIAHRGGADLWPENTLSAFAGAIACGADGAELDVHLTRDGELVVYHDEALKPELTRDSQGVFLERTGPLLKSTSFQGLQAYDVGRLKPGTAYAARHPRQTPQDGARIPLLRDVIRLAKDQSDRFTLWIELKTDLERPVRGADPETLAEAAVALVEAEGLAARTVFVSFDWRALKRTQELHPDIPTYATTLPQSWFGAAEPPAAHGPPPPRLLAAYRHAASIGAPWEAECHPKDHGSLQGAIKALGATGWFPFWPDLNTESVARARALGLKLAAWTVPASRTAEIAAWQVDAICTDDPVTAREMSPS